MSDRGYSVSARTGRVQAAEGDAAFMPRVTNGSTRFPLIGAHGAGSSWDQFFSTSWLGMNQLMTEAARHGIPGMVGHFGGDTYGNATGKARVGAAHTAVVTAAAPYGGTSAAKAHLVSMSMGNTLAFGYAIENPTKVASITSFLPLSSLINTYENNVAGLRAAIGTAWGVVHPTPLPAAADLVTGAAAIQAAGIPVRLYYAPDDGALIPVADVLALAAAAGGTATATVGGGHTNAGAFTGFNFADWVDFLIANGG
jgi:pimeloyl-ACP methyl ester carboxylesterase